MWTYWGFEMKSIVKFSLGVVVLLLTGQAMATGPSGLAANHVIRNTVTIAWRDGAGNTNPRSPSDLIRFQLRSSASLIDFCLSE